MEDDTIFNRLKEWREDRHLVGYNHKNHVKCIAEELFELMGYNKNEVDVKLKDFLLMHYKKGVDMDTIMDASCDGIIYHINFMEQARYNAECCIQETIDEISSRKGSYDESEGKWVKDPNQDKDSLYKANYADCRYIELVVEDSNGN